MTSLQIGLYILTTVSLVVGILIVMTTRLKNSEEKADLDLNKCFAINKKVVAENAALKTELTATQIELGKAKKVMLLADNIIYQLAYILTCTKDYAAAQEVIKTRWRQFTITCETKE